MSHLPEVQRIDLQAVFRRLEQPSAAATAPTSAAVPAEGGVTEPATTSDSPASSSSSGAGDAPAWYRPGKRLRYARIDGETDGAQRQRVIDAYLGGSSGDLRDIEATVAPAVAALYIDDDDDLGIVPSAAMAKDPNLADKVDGKTNTLVAFKRSEESDDWRRLMSDHLVRRTRSFIKKSARKKAVTLPDGTTQMREYLQFADGTEFFFPTRIPHPLTHAFGIDDPASMMEDDTTLDAIARLNHAGCHVVIAANMPGLGRGLFDVSALNAMHAKMHRMLAAVGGRVDAVFYCPHAPEEACTCRKPAPGLFTQVAERYGVSLTGMPSVGDSARDLVAAQAVGCSLHAVLTGKAAGYRDQPLPASYPAHTMVHVDLASFADYLVAQV